VKAIKNFLDAKWFSLRIALYNSIEVPGGALLELKNAPADLNKLVILVHI
jgi:hypothetical protein